MSLAQYLSDYLGTNLEKQLGYDAEGSYSKIVAMTLEAYPVDNEEQATDLTKLHKLGIWKLWEQIVKDLTFDFDISVDGSSYKRSQAIENAKFNYQNAYVDAVPYISSTSVKIQSFPVRRNHHDSNEFSRCH